ncbi:MAG: hypothetical protein ACE5H4_11965 [Candidatus Thorarchaeota archaeon]
MQELELNGFEDDEETIEEAYSIKLCRSILVITWLFSAMFIWFALNSSQFIEIDVLGQIMPYCWACFMVTASWIAIKVYMHFRRGPIAFQL